MAWAQERTQLLDPVVTVGAMSSESDFTRQQWVEGLLPEIASARNVLATADFLLRRGGTLERDIDAVFATYSIGLERLMKLALGCAAVSRGEGWPPKMGRTSEGWGHALDEMDQRLRDTIRESVNGNEWDHKPLLETWICTLDNDPVWGKAVKALRNYADAGRYHHLDHVRGGFVTSSTTRSLWDDVERETIANNSQLAAHHQETLAGAEFDPFEIELRSAVADVLKRWVSIICLFGMHGVLGEDWKSLGADALPDGALEFDVLPQREGTR